jgi:hypothetical protein
MSRSNRDILVVLKRDWISEEELEGIHELLQSSISPDKFCVAHELVNRNKITRKTSLIMRESRHFNLRPFRFLICRN